MLKRLVFIVTTLLSSSLLLSGCGAVIVGGAAVGASVAHDRRETKSVLEDQNIRYSIIDVLNQDKSISENSSIGITSYNANVLLTGTAKTEPVRQAAAQIAANMKDVRRVYNEIIIGKNPTIADESKDSWITSRVKAGLFSIEMEGFDASRIKVVTANSVVFLMGIVTAQESEAVIDQARHAGGVKKVVHLFESKP